MIEICNFFLVLNLTMCIKPFTFINTIFSVSFLNDISPFNIFVFFKHTIIELHLKLDRRLLTDDWLSKTFISDIPSQMHPFSITVWWFVYNICVNFYFQKFWLIHLLSFYREYDLWFMDVWFICSPFWFLNLLEYFPKQFSSPVFVFCFSWQQLHSRFLVS